MKKIKNSERERQWGKSTWDFKVHGEGENNGGEGQRNGEDPKLQVSLINNVHLSLFHQFTARKTEYSNQNLLFGTHTSFQTIFFRSNSDCRIVNGRSSHLGSTSSNDLKIFCC